MPCKPASRSPRKTFTRCTPSRHPLPHTSPTTKHGRRANLCGCKTVAHGTNRPQGTLTGGYSYIAAPCYLSSKRCACPGGKITWLSGKKRKGIWKGWAENFRRGKRGWWGGLCAVCEECRCTVECGLCSNSARQHQTAGMTNNDFPGQYSQIMT